MLTGGVDGGKLKPTRGPTLALASYALSLARHLMMEAGADPDAALAGFRLVQGSNDHRLTLATPLAAQVVADASVRLGESLNEALPAALRAPPSPARAWAESHLALAEMGISNPMVRVVTAYNQTVLRVVSRADLPEVEPARPQRYHVRERCTLVSCNVGQRPHVEVFTIFQAKAFRIDCDEAQARELAGVLANGDEVRLTFRATFDDEHRILRGDGITEISPVIKGSLPAILKWLEEVADDLPSPYRGAEP